MQIRFETTQGEFTVFVSESQIRIVGGGSDKRVSLQAVGAIVDREPFGGEIQFEDGSCLTYLQVRTEIFLHYRGETWSFMRNERKLSFAESSVPEVKSPMPGKIIQMIAEVGKKFHMGETILIMEAMKMENAIKAPFDCIVREILHNVGEIVQQDESIVILDKITAEIT